MKRLGLILVLCGLAATLLAVIWHEDLSAGALPLILGIPVLIFGEKHS